jgi:hypothetical protein
MFKDLKRNRQGSPDSHALQEPLAKKIRRDHVCSENNYNVEIRIEEKRKMN